MKQRNPIKTLFADRQGAVMLEFIISLPIYLLVFGATMLLFELFVGKLHLQESNRNISWIANDRNSAGSQEDFNALVRTHFDNRNLLEQQISGEPLYSFGDDPEKWGILLTKKVMGNDEFVGVTKWSEMTSGNMDLKMEKVSGLYVGAVGLVSVMYPPDQSAAGPDLYQRSFELTRTITPQNVTNGSLDPDYYPEAVLLRRVNHETCREEIGRVFEYMNEEWPGLTTSNQASLGENNSNSGNTNNDPPAMDGSTRYRRLLYPYTQ